MKATLRNDLLYPELSFQIVGCAFDVFNKVGPGHKEKIYQSALSSAFEEKGLKCIQQLKREIIYNGKKIGYGFLDFLVEEKVVVEIKRGNHFSPADFEQLKGYLAGNNLQLGILIRFAADQVIFKRVVHTSPAFETVR